MICPFPLVVQTCPSILNLQTSNFTCDSVCISPKLHLKILHNLKWTKEKKSNSKDQNSNSDTEIYYYWKVLILMRIHGSQTWGILQKILQSHDKCKIPPGSFLLHISGFFKFKNKYNIHCYNFKRKMHK